MEESFAAALRQTRRSRGLSQEALAERADLSTKAIGLLERGVRRHPHLTTIDKLETALHLSPAELAVFRRLAARKSAPAGPDTSWVVADQLPTTRASFTGRARHLEQLKRALTTGEAQAGATVIVTVRGMAGVGKTALAVEAAEACRATYPDGVLSVNLRGFGSGTPLSPVQAIGQLLRATGVPAELLPTDQTDAITALRTRLANRRVLLLLDNARDVSHVTDLIPSTRGAAVLITSRNTLTTLPARQHIQLEPMPVSDSVKLLTSSSGTDRLGDSADQIAALCGHLPLALSVAGAWLLQHPDTPAAELVRRLADETHRLDLLGVDDRDVRASLSLSVDHLTNSPRPHDHEAARVFTLLGLTAAGDFTAESVAALLQTAPARAGDLLEHLTDLHLLESSTPGRYHLHDLVRTFAHELGRELPEAERAATVDRLLSFYLSAAWRSGDLADPQAARNAWPGRPPTPKFPVFKTSEQALGWLDTELANYLAIIDQTAALGTHDEAVAGVVVGLYSYFTKRGNLVDWLPAIDRVLDGRIDRWTYAQLQADAAIALAELARYDESAIRFGLARDAFETIGNLRGVSLTTTNNARLLVRMGRYAEALPLAEQALAINQQLGNTRALGASYGTLTEIHTELGDWAAAEAAATAAVEQYTAAGSSGYAANIRIEGAWARARSGHSDVAIADLTQSLSELEKLGLHKSVCDGRWVLGMTYLLRKELEQGIEQAELALEIALDVQDIRREAQVRVLLGELLNEIGDRDEAVANLEFAIAFYRQHHPGKATDAEALLTKVRNETSA
ncbi:helix-turn-helix domain-containing protein [Kribbella antibiotica]|uniref:Helix-turn-helix domain-containing protein n=1 Tax=Kribbella antibiotica TaxID=190195 RepID=A0A4R4ZKQ3_9ACTN|nr:helix-turn-helix domain-containing protein [Kribbella antibiotica]TDD58646.1 helix-turn-helix domain-containing protein [Kribbella antibiotica]